MRPKKNDVGPLMVVEILIPWRVIVSMAHKKHNPERALRGHSHRKGGERIAEVKAKASKKADQVSQ